MAEVESIIEKRNSVEISVNAKGQYSGKVKVYKQNINDAFEEAIIKAEQLERLILKKNS